LRVGEINLKACALLILTQIIQHTWAVKHRPCP